MPALSGLEHSRGQEYRPKEKKKITEPHAVDLTYLLGAWETPQVSHWKAKSQPLDYQGSPWMIVNTLLLQWKRQFIGKERIHSLSLTTSLLSFPKQRFSDPNLSFHRCRRVPETQPIYLRAGSTKDMSCVFWIPQQVVFFLKKNKKHTPCFIESKIPLFLRHAIVLCSSKK